MICGVLELVEAVGLDVAGKEPAALAEIGGVGVPVEVESQVGVGSVFSLHLPAATEEDR
jgi:chemotaxis protein histidine kinase CheA